MIDVRPCPAHRGAVDLLDTRPGSEEDGDVAIQIHLSPADWQEFLANAKAGKYDRLTP